MKSFAPVLRPLVPTLLALTGFVTSALAQEVSIPDPGLNTAIREALQKPNGPLTEEDLLSLTNLNASGRSIRSVQGLEAARNLTTLDLDSNSLTDFVLPGALTNLLALELFNNHLTNVVLPNGLLNLAVLDLGFNSLGQCSIPGGLTNLDTLFLEGNQLTDFTLPAGLTSLTQLDLSGNALTCFAFPADMTNLVTALLFANQLTNVVLPPNLIRLGSLDFAFNRLRRLVIPAALANLRTLTLFGNQLTNLTLPPGMTKLSFLDVGDNQLGSITLPAGLNNLSFLRLSGNRLTSLALPSGMTNLTAAFLRSNQLSSLTLPPGLTHLVQIDVMDNQLTSLTLPPDVTQLITLVLEGNPLTTLVLSEPSAATNLAVTASLLRNQGVSVFTYPLAVQLIRLQQPIGAFQFAITGPPGDYVVLGSTDLAVWSPLGAVSNGLGAIVFTDGTAHLSPRKFYRARLQSPPTNMVFIPPNTFTMGSPTNEVDRSSNEGPQTTVILSRGFWIGEYEVTQGEYLSVMNTNPSPFPGDLSRPVSSVSWLDASNYCAKLTERELAAGRIPPGSQYRLPTEAEWECAARAGTSTRFSYGDDPGYASLASHAWYASNSGFMPHPVGQKIPNSWGLYDIEGNVVEWCQDWFGLLPGGVQTDPTGPASSSSGRKVTRGGAFDNTQQSSRSAARSLFNAGPFDTDTDLGFRVALVTGP